jgi:plastocyanin
VKARRAGAALLVAAALVAGCGDGGGSADTTPETLPPVDVRGQDQVIVQAKDNFFDPAAIIVDAGTQVTWVNDGSVAHNVRKSADALDFGAPFGVDTGAFAPGARYTFTFAEPGSFTYTCTIHTLMDGQVTVEERAPSPSTTASSTVAPAPTPTS